MKNDFKTQLREEYESNIKGGIYHKIQVELTYNSNHIEGSQLSEDQTRYIYETNTIGLTNDVINVNDIIETVNHFKCIDYMIEHMDDELDVRFIKDIHKILKTNTEDSRKNWFAIGEWKKIPNEVGSMSTVASEEVDAEMNALLIQYHQRIQKNLDNLLDFHYRFEKIHPFQDGNGRVGRLILFKECLKNNMVPFIIADPFKLYYYRGLKEWAYEKGFLRDTCLAAQDRFKQYLDYFHLNFEKHEDKEAENKKED